MAKQYHVLIVEDEPLISSALKAKCEIEGFKVTVANNGQVGLDLALSEHPDFILLDIIMPVMDGMTMLKKLRKDKWGETVPVLLWTNLNDMRYMEDRLKYNAVDYLVKSGWTPEQAVSQIKLKLGLSAAK
jgi:two-component system alkaline phosphatase synthesis response regulator PhoP